MDFKEAYNSPKLYDAECDVVCNDIEFWKQITLKYTPKNVLEIGCGTGRVAKAILNSIDSYTGIDLSKEFLQFFMDSVPKHEKTRINLIHANACDLLFDKQFEMIILPFNFISHLQNDDELEKLFVSLRSALCQNGKIIVDYFNPQLRFLDMRIKNQYCYTVMFQNQEIRVYETQNYNELLQVNTIERVYLSNEKVIKRSYLPTRIYFNKELEYIIEKSGLTINQVFGNYNFESTKEYCEKLIYVLS